MDQLFFLGDLVVRMRANLDPVLPKECEILVYGPEGVVTVRAVAGPAELRRAATSLVNAAQIIETNGEAL